MILDKHYNHLESEPKWYEIWESKGYFKANPESGKPGYSIVLPPPNVTGSLHLGHSVMTVVQDVLSRYKRMKGYDVLWLPGTDHAGIATQMVVERELAKEGVSRHDLGREKFLEKVWEWKHKNGSRITKQLRCLGTSLDWSRERFTMDEGLSKAVKEVFVSLYEEKLIYRDNYIINWCPRCQTAISDLEVDYQDKPGNLWHLLYPVKDLDIKLEIATTRPETMLGDTAVAVHPDDPRYSHLIGKFAMLPLMNREIPIIGDAELVDMEFGTGVVKVTPAHDFNDFATGKRHNLEQINVIDETGHINENGGKFKGLHVLEARKVIVEELTSLGLISKIEDYSHSVGHCDRCKTVVEPILSKQWFVKIEPLAKPAIEAVETGKIKMIPEHHKKTYFEWMNNIKDWCISRQLWWGHQIPAWYCHDCGEVVVSRETPLKCTKCGSSDLKQDSDVLDTWFSSGLWPFSTMGWPEKTPDLMKYYPTDVMETGFDIIFFWVARMIMMGIKFMDDIPFKTVYFHGLVRDEKGQKMSKTKGNVIDPLEITDEFSADALRFTLAMLPLQSRDIKLSKDWIAGYRNFINKIYNATKFALMQFDEDKVFEFNPSEYVEDNFSPVDKWILTRLEETVEKVTSGIEEYRLHDSAAAIYHFFWHEFCDWYIELIKPTFFGDNEDEKSVARRVIIKVLDVSLKLLHPFMPFVTEELWQHLPFTFDGKDESIMITPFPEKNAIPSFKTDADNFEKVLEIIKSIRNIRSENNIKPSQEIKAYFVIETSDVESIVDERKEYLNKLARVSEIEFRTNYEPDKNTASSKVSSGTIYIPLHGLVDFSEEITRLKKELARIAVDFEKSDNKLKNPKFIENAAIQAIEKEKQKHAEFLEKINHIKERLDGLN